MASKKSRNLHQLTVNSIEILLVALANLLFFSTIVLAQNFPTKPIRLIVPFAPGGAADIMGRMIADKLQIDLVNPVIIVNKDGGGTIIGVDYVAKSPPDGYTLLLGNDAMAINSATGRKLPYDLQKDLAPISLVYLGPQIVLVNKASPFNSLIELVSYARANSSALKYGSSGIGSSTHLSTAALCEAANINPTHLPYRGIAPAINDLLGGHIDFLVAGTASALPLLKSGSVKSLAILSKERLPLLPSLATANEQGIHTESAGWYGVLAPAGTPTRILSKISNTLVLASQNTEFREKLLALSGEPQGMNEVAFSSFIKSEIQKFSKLIKTRDIQIQ